MLIACSTSEYSGLRAALPAAYQGNDPRAIGPVLAARRVDGRERTAAHGYRFVSPRWRCGRPAVRRHAARARRPAGPAQWLGKPLLVNFWVRWCAPRRVEISELAKLGAEQRRHGLEIVGIAVEDKVEAVGDFVRACDIDYRVLVAGAHGVPLMQALGNTKSGLPLTIAVDRRGRIVAGKLGAMPPAELKSAAEAALQ